MTDKEGHGIPKYIKMRKDGMWREEQVKNKWNDSFGNNQKKQFNVKQRPDFSNNKQTDEKEKSILDFFDSVTLPKNFSTDAPEYQVKQNKKPEAKRQPNSGAMWYAKGDISLEHALVEVKDYGTKNSRGEKTISIPKAWLDKQAEEAYLQGKEFWYLTFAYKGDDDIYLIKPYDDEIEMIALLRKLQNENELLRKINKELGEEKQ